MTGVLSIVTEAMAAPVAVPAGPGAGNEAACNQATRPQGLEQIETLKVYNTDLLDGTSIGCRCTGLRRLVLSFCYRVEFAMDTVAGLQHLEHLELNRMDLSPPLAAKLVALSGLRRLSFTESNFVDEALKHVQRLERLECLDLSDASCNGESLGCLEKLPRLTNLTLDFTLLATLARKSSVASSKLRA